MTRVPTGLKDGMLNLKESGRNQSSSHVPIILTESRQGRQSRPY